MVRKNKGRWTCEEHDAFLRGVQLHKRDWDVVAVLIPTRTVRQVRTHSQKYFHKIDNGKLFPSEVRGFLVGREVRERRAHEQFVCDP